MKIIQKVFEDSELSRTECIKIPVRKIERMIRKEFFLRLIDDK